MAPLGVCPTRGTAGEILSAFSTCSSCHTSRLRDKPASTCGLYLAHSLLFRELSQVAREREEPDTARRVHTGAPVPDRERIYADMAKVFLQDLANVEVGIYPIPADRDGSLLALIHRSRIFLDDLPNVHRRRKRRAYNEVLNEATRGKRPSYYLQNFHYQSGGWLTEKSAELYDTQVENLFYGSANAIRRQALPQLHEIFADGTNAS